MVLDKFVFYWIHEEKLREIFIISLSIKILSVIICAVVYGKHTHSFYKNLLKVHENSSPHHSPRGSTVLVDPQSSWIHSPVP
jgi:hypothetical protein